MTCDNELHLSCYVALILHTLTNILLYVNGKTIERFCFDKFGIERLKSSRSLPYIREYRTDAKVKQETLTLPKPPHMSGFGTVRVVLRVSCNILVI